MTMTMTAPEQAPAEDAVMAACIARREAAPVRLGLMHPADAPEQARCSYCGLTGQTARMFYAGGDWYGCADTAGCESRHLEREAQRKAAAQAATEAEDAPEEAQDEPEGEQPAQDGHDASGEAAQDAAETDGGQ